MTRKKIVVRSIVIGTLSAVLAARVSHDMLRKQALGRDGYLQYQGNWFDKYLANFAHPFGHTVAYAIFFAAGLLVYELIVLIVDPLYSFVRPENSSGVNGASSIHSDDSNDQLHI